ncbi:hypothetical protein PV05_09146 [Exophiala xenobiotica]|uniref:RING-type domain-containing protein n=1 Tax=Exophiala xenobiotica TaxID=348802 RepID=A0A0D2F0T7_9EURO|nr:uncharacterized protein PV05_09146 [Exophiala xenobiotica]KIW53589.1 hypothetical protein PV05_09146 [Exophiala xenobiotica]
MASQPVSANAAANVTPKNRTVVTVSVLVGMLFLIVLIAWCTGWKRPPQPEPTILVYRHIIKEQRDTGVSKSFVDSIPLVKYKTVVRVARLDNATDEEANISVGGQVDKNVSTKDDCPVCVETFASSDEVRILSCGHIYHHRCIDPWLLRVSGTCPICRTDLAKAISSTKAQPTAPRPAHLAQ